MKTCPTCGNNANDSALYCPTCGYNFNYNPNSNSNNSQYNNSNSQYNNSNSINYYNENTNNISNTGSIVFSIFILLCCCLPFGIVGLVYAINATNQPTYEQGRRYISISNKWNIAGLLSTVVVAILYFVVVFVIFRASSSFYFY